MLPGFGGQSPGTRSLASTSDWILLTAFGFVPIFFLPGNGYVGSVGKTDVGAGDEKLTLVDSLLLLSLLSVASEVTCTLISFVVEPDDGASPTARKVMLTELPAARLPSLQVKTALLVQRLWPMRGVVARSRYDGRVAFTTTLVAGSGPAL